MLIIVYSEEISTVLVYVAAGVAKAKADKVTGTVVI